MTGTEAEYGEAPSDCQVVVRELLLKIYSIIEMH